MTDHPLTEPAVAALWTAHRTPNAVPFPEQGDLYVRGQTAMLRAAFDAGREHERTTPAEPLARTLLGVPEGHGAPHRNEGEIQPGDFVLEVDAVSRRRVGIAHHQDGAGNWFNEHGRLLAWPARRADRPDALTVWPAPTPPAEEVELPSEHPAHITDVETDDGHGCAYMALDHDGDWCGVSTTGMFLDRRPQDFAAFTLPDGTRARRDGDHPDGKPRFVKTQEGEK